jgi:hypothetical protein
VNVSNKCLTGHEADRNTNESAALNRDTDTTDCALPRGGITLREIRTKRRKVDGASGVNDLVVRYVNDRGRTGRESNIGETNTHLCVIVLIMRVVL